ncbi:MAG: hypothetical protein ACPGFA_12125 [Pikeienuella sp.]
MAKEAKKAAPKAADKSEAYKAALEAIRKKGGVQGAMAADALNG